MVILLLAFGFPVHILGQSAPASVETTQPSASAPTQTVHLYFIGDDGRHLKAEGVEVAAGQLPVALGQDILQALFQGPKAGLRPIFSKPVALRSFFIDDQDTAYVDLPGSVREAQPGGITEEQMALYAIVNSLVLNVPEVAAVKVLIDSHEAETFAGHIDISYPLTANLLLIR